MPAPQRQFAINIKHAGTNSRWWSGSGTLELAGETYEGTFVKNADGTEGSAIALEAPENLAGEVGNRCRFKIAVTDETIRRAVSVDLGPVECEIYWIYPSLLVSAGTPQIQYAQDIDDLGVIESAGDLIRTLFSGAIIQNNLSAAGRWNSRAVGSTPSGSTGPGSNNLRKYIYYEASFSGYQNSAGRSILQIDGGTARTTEVVNWLNSSNARRVIVDLCLQGSMYADPNDYNGLYLWSSPTPPNFGGGDAAAAAAVQALYREKADGWLFSNSYGAGATVTDYQGEDFLVQETGGWRRMAFDVPNGHNYVGLAVEINNVPSGSSNFHGDAAITAISLEESVGGTTEMWAISDQFFGNLSGPTISLADGVYQADIEGPFGRAGSGRVRKWSDANQQALYPGDRCFENVEQIQRGAVKIRW